MIKTPEYRAFARDMMKLCKKHGISMSALDEGLVLLGPAGAKKSKDFPCSEFKFTPDVAFLKFDKGGVIEINRAESESEG